MVMVTAFALFVSVQTQTAMSTVQSEVLAIEKMRLAAKRSSGDDPTGIAAASVQGFVTL